MNENRKIRNELLAQTVIKGLKSRHMNGYYAETKEKALELALKMIPEGSTIGWGGSMSIAEIGLRQAVLDGNYTVFDRGSAKDEAEKKEIDKNVYGCDYYLTSTNAITEDGILVNLDGNSNRVASIAYGPEHVIMIVGMNKVARDVDAAVYRVRNEAAPVNSQRFQNPTPCVKTGVCGNCKSPDSICCNMLITRLERHPDRIHVILVNDNLGF
ncbi:MAG: lactate utilization protein [Eubacterium sp.]|nr:lactate utilization protein [Eubacterium sp.]